MRDGCDFSYRRNGFAAVIRNRIHRQAAHGRGLDCQSRNQQRVAVHAALTPGRTRCFFAATVSDVRTIGARHCLNYALSELTFVDGDAIDVVKALQSSVPFCRTIVHSRSRSLQLAVRATKPVQVVWLPKPVDIDFLLSLLPDQNAQNGNASEFPGNPFKLRMAYALYTYFQCGSNPSRAARVL